MATYSLPELPYDYGALEPHISGRIMELHHSKHHNTYVNGANTALEKLAAAREAGDFRTSTSCRRTWHSTWVDTPTTRSSGTTCLQTAATNQPVNWLLQSTSTSVPSTTSRHSLLLQR